MSVVPEKREAGAAGRGGWEGLTMGQFSCLGVGGGWCHTEKVRNKTACGRNCGFIWMWLQVGVCVCVRFYLHC